MDFTFRTITNLAEGTFLLWVAWSSYSYYNGKKKFDEESEKRRKKVTEKYKILFFVVIVIAFISGTGIILNTIFG
jgi:hypothetical protein